MQKAKSEPECKLWASGDYGVACRFVRWNTYTTLVGDVENGGGSAFGKAGSTWESSIPSSQFCCEHKISLKKYSFFLIFKYLVQISLVFDMCDH
jgi:hypothetical protein